MIFIIKNEKTPYKGSVFSCMIEATQFEFDEFLFK